ncbi:MAG: hypothetical protein AAF985_08925 [Bacteroidota bacterium]
MKMQIKAIALFLLFFVLVNANAKTVTIDSTGWPGDHFSLEGALTLFKKAASPEQFEQLLNSEDNYVNNLDLNEDNEIDYVRVVDHQDGEVHAIVLQVPINAEESQDIAVIEIEKTGTDQAALQIVGDETIYGERITVEPYEMEGKAVGKGPAPEMEFYRVVVNVWLWPSVRYIYRPAYRPWVSPWRWSTYPNYWRPWRPRPWRQVYGYRVAYRPSFRVVATPRLVRARRVYTPVRRSSTVVRSRVVVGRNGKAVRRTRTTTRVNPRTGNVTRTKKTTTVRKGKNGVKVRKKKTVRKRRRN